MTEYSHLVTLKSGLYSYAITNLGIIRGSNKTRHQKMWNIQVEGKSYICCVHVICVQYFRIHNLCRSKERKKERKKEREKRVGQQLQSTKQNENVRLSNRK